jgi:lysozyme family protein
MPQYSFGQLRKGYDALWTRAVVTKTEEAARHARRVLANKQRYLAVEQTTKVPWFVIGCLHLRESNANFATWLHNGDPMRRNGKPVRTVRVPAGRPPNPDCSWEEGAYDALVNVEQLNEIEDWSPAHVAYASEKFNGFGYRHPSRNIPSPYLWGGTTVQKPGKFIRDGVYDPSVMDSQIGTMAVLKAIMMMDPDADFSKYQQTEPEPDTVVSAQSRGAPLAIDDEAHIKPLTKSKTLWGGISGSLGGVTALFAGFFDKLDNPYTLAAFLAVLTIIAGGLYYVIRGRLDTNAIIKHLSDTDDTENY